MIERIKGKAKELLQNKVVDCVIGYERATDGINARPLFAYSPEEINRFIFDKTCVHNLSKYLLDRRNKTTGIVVKPCDSRAINVLLNEKQLERNKVFIIGVVCGGVVKTNWGVANNELEWRCQKCRQHTPPVYDYLVGDPIPEDTSPSSYEDLSELELKTPDKRWEYWQQHFNRCIRCYGCRQVCPGCYCIECFADRLDPMWVGIRIAPSENRVWHTIRAYHLASRCIDCGECERVCPVNIPLMKLNHRFEKEVLQSFRFMAGMDSQIQPPFLTFKKEDSLDVLK